MNKDLLEKLASWQGNTIFGEDLRVLVSGSDNSVSAIIKRAVAEGYLQRLKRDIYLIRRFKNKPKINLYEIAQSIYGPSYVSFESALSIHGWIPEAVHTISSASLKKSRHFNTPIASFSYEKVPQEHFTLGVEHITDGNAQYMLATPWKALADFIYKRKKIWINIDALILDMRIEIHSLLSSDLQLLIQLGAVYPHKQTRQTLMRLNHALIEKNKEIRND